RRARRAAAMPCSRPRAWDSRSTSGWASAPASGRASTCPRHPMDSLDAPRLADLLRIAYAATPTYSRPVTGEFLEMWQDAAGGAYAAPAARLLDLLILNRAIAARAEGPEGEP